LVYSHFGTASDCAMLSVVVCFDGAIQRGAELFYQILELRDGV
jgi:hypothetical protein